MRKPKLDFNKREQAEIKAINRTFGYMASLYETSITHKGRDNLHYNVKIDPKSGRPSEYGYYISSYNLGDLYVFLRKNNKMRFLDLGCGVGHLIYALASLGLDTEGYEIEDALIKESLKTHYSKYGLERALKTFRKYSRVKKRNITTLTEKSISRFDVIYLYEPIISEVKIRKMVRNLYKSLNKDQLIVDNGGYSFRNEITEHGGFKFHGHVGNSGLTCFSKK